MDDVEYRNDGSLAVKADELKEEEVDGETVVVVPDYLVATAFESHTCGDGHAIEWQRGVQWMKIGYSAGPCLVGGCVKCGRVFAKEIK